MGFGAASEKGFFCQVGLPGEPVIFHECVFYLEDEVGWYREIARPFMG